MIQFLVGIVVGAAATVVYNKNEKVRDGVKESGECIKKYATQGYEKSKELANEAKQKFDELKEKKCCKKDDKCDDTKEDK